MRHLFFFIFFVTALILTAGPSYAGPKNGIVTETFFIASDDPSIKLHIRNKYPSGQALFPPEKIVLFVHGATYPSESTFDIDLPGGSWMEYAARRGYDTYFVDIRGYGRSTRPSCMDVSPDKNPPFCHHL